MCKFQNAMSRAGHVFHRANCQPISTSCLSQSLAMTVNDKEDEYWIFGYGSLLFKPPPFYDRRVAGYVEGYVRRFWQSSNDHRGVPEAPGRVVTLITKEYWKTLDDPHPASDDDTVWGVAYRIRADKVDYVKEYLDIREKNGYSIHQVPFKVADSGDKIPNCTVYIGTPGNEAFVGPQQPIELARHILKSKGPSGENREYLFKLGESLKQLSPKAHDHHIEELIELATQIEQE